MGGEMSLATAAAEDAFGIEICIILKAHPCPLVRRIVRGTAGHDLERLKVKRCGGRELPKTVRGSVCVIGSE